MEDWRDKLGAAFGAESEQFKAETPEVEAEPASWADNLKAQQGKQMANVMLDKRNRNGKKVTLVTDLLCDDDTLKELARELKAQCGVGGSARGGEILIQGDFRDKVLAQLKARGLKARII
ncbi:MAG: translation initiation factor [Muribaculaceae bacterium]|nr:translation initiation factor [Muribaculaceae bacterium]